MSQVIPITDAQIEAEVLRSEIPVLIDFYADWCQPCKTLAPRVAEIAKRYAGTLKVVKIDVDANPAATQMFRIQAMPTLVLLHQQQIVDVLQGAVDATTLDKFVSQVAQPGGGGGAEAWDVERTKLGLEAMVAVTVDTRADVDFKRAHIPGAVHVSAEALGADPSLLPNDGRDVILYDRDGTTIGELAQKVAESGAAVGFLEDGFLGWEARLYPVERG